MSDEERRLELNEAKREVDDEEAAAVLEPKPEPTPKNSEPKKGGTKFDDGKTRWDLLPWDPLEQIALVLMGGADKYGIGNWEKGYSWRKMASAVFRHFTAWLRGQKRDPDSGLNPLAHVGACVLFLLHYDIHRDRYKDFDDRFINEG